MPVISGRSFSASSNSDDLQQFLANKLQARTGCNGSMEYSLTWKERTTPAGRPICALRALARRTSGSGCTGWPTTRANDAEKRGQPSIDPRNGLVSAAMLTGWPTPVAQPANGEPEDFLRRKRESVARGHSMGVCLSDLQMVAKLTGWPTTTTRDHKDGPFCPNVPTNALLGRAVWSSPAAMGRLAGSVLNPAMSRWLMGFPAIWDAHAPSWKEWDIIQRKSAECYDDPEAFSQWLVSVGLEDSRATATPLSHKSRRNS